MHKILDSKHAVGILLAALGLMILWSLPEVSLYFGLGPLVSPVIGLLILIALTVWLWRTLNNSKSINAKYRKYSAKVESSLFLQVVLVSLTGILCVILLTVLLFAAFPFAGIVMALAVPLCHLLTERACTNYWAIFGAIYAPAVGFAIFLIGLLILRFAARLGWLLAAEVAVTTAFAWPLGYSLIPKVFPEFHIYGPLIYFQLYLFAIIGFPLHWIILKPLNRSKIMGVIATILLIAMYILAPIQL